MVLYDIGLYLFRAWLSLASLFDRKIREGIDGRKNLLEKLATQYRGVLSQRKRIVVHVSSFGELEQAKPIIEALKSEWPNAHLHLTFFSPSGYLNSVGKYTVPDLITYLPFDTKGNVKQFLDITQPDIFLFARYDVWHNLARELKKRNIASVLFSATFMATSFKRFPLIKNIQRRTYEDLSKIFCISDRDRNAFVGYGIPAEQLAVAGDTRFDQVVKRKSDLPERSPEVSVSLHERLTDEHTFTIVAGSTWQADEEVIASVCMEMVEHHQQVYFIIAPHELSERRLTTLENTFKNTSRLSFYNGGKIIIVDSIGKLFNLYRYASVAYVGGGFGSGVHNVLEPAVWGAPIVIGPKHERSQEIALLLDQGGAFEATDSSSFGALIKSFFENRELRQKAAEATIQFVAERRGACEQVMTFVRKLLILRTPS